MDDLDALIESVGHEPSMAVVTEHRSRPGPVPGLPIVLHPRRAEIDLLIFVKRLPREKLRVILREEYGLDVGRRMLENYIKHYSEEYNEIAVLPGSVVLQNIEQTVKRDMEVLDAIINEAPRLIDRNAVNIKNVLAAISIRQKMLGDHNALQLLTAEEKYRRAMQAFLEIIHEVVDETTKLRLQTRMLADPRIVAAMNTSLEIEEIDGDAETVDDDDAA